MRKSLVAVAFMSATPAAFSAPLVDVYAGAYTWNAELSGDIATGSDKVDLEKDLDFDKTRENVFYIGLEHPVPLVPNVRLRHITVSDDQRNTLTRNFSFGGGTFIAGNTVRSDFDLDITDATLYYSPLDNWLNLDLGLTVRRMDAEFTIESGAQRGHEKAEKTIPMLHVAAQADLPLTGFYVGAEVNTISYDGSKLQDSNLHVGWASDFLLGVELGYSRMDLELDDVSNLDSDITIGGPYLALALRF